MLTAIIIGGWIYVIGNYGKNETNNKIIKSVNQVTENYYDILEKKCDGDNCCLASLKRMRANNYKEADKNGKCPEGFFMDMMKCVTSYQSCVPTEKNKCLLTPKTGPCKAIIKKYYFDYEENKCQEFIWGGCQGVVPFETIENCKKECEKQANTSDLLFKASATDDWQTYRNEEFGFEMKYPEYYFEDKYDLENMTDLDYERIHFFRGMSDDVLNDFKEHYITSLHEGGTHSGTIDIKLYSESELKNWYKIDLFNDLKLKKYSNFKVYILEIGNVGFYYIIPHNNVDNLYFIFNIPAGLQNNFENKWLSTFKFIN